MSLTRPRAVIRGGCCQHPDDCREPGEVCLTRDRWEEEQTAPEPLACGWCSTPMDAPASRVPGDL